jgi:hypothetical protein
MACRKAQHERLPGTKSLGLGFPDPRWPGPMEMSSAGVGSRSCVAVGVVWEGIVWFCQAGARTRLKGAIKLALRGEARASQRSLNRRS